MSKYTFVCEHYDGSKVTFEKEAETLNEVLETFEFFLKGSGFFFKGQLDFVPLEEDNNTFTCVDDDEDGGLFDFGAGQPIISTNGTMFDGYSQNIEISLDDAQAALFNDNITNDSTIVIK